MLSLSPETDEGSSLSIAQTEQTESSARAVENNSATRHAATTLETAESSDIPGDPSSKNAKVVSRRYPLRSLGAGLAFCGLIAWAISPMTALAAGGALAAAMVSLSAWRTDRKSRMFEEEARILR
ncbi:MAG: hypothetical protein K8F25_13485, partial [Fimbriimonadaceae bacterium]|nr:hypothetical protein [Alphaproteobacteria bacterium]